ncbi:Retrovirus-related Pol polyprotein from transposon 17.6, partial [Mucuna pruriens]
MDAYSGYNQIRMHPFDEEKTTFIMEERVFCYKVMPFGLKNTGATYQRLMDKIFEKTIEVDIEVYVDDMVVKSEKENRHCEMLEYVFKTLRDHQLKLNLEKCSFEVQAGKFLGFMLTERGIKANPDKCQAIIDMSSPQGVKEVQQLMGKIIALSRFIPQSAEMAQPIFGALKKGRRFAWTSECKEAFQKLKATIAAPPVLTRLVSGIPLCLYFSAFDNAISAVLVQEREGEQRPTRPHQSSSNSRLPRRINPRRGREEEGEWYLLVDGSSNHTRSGAKIILEGPTGVLIEQSLHFEFKASNNQVEYEALLAGMKLAQELGTKKLTAKSDSKLVTRQINGDYQVKDPQLAKYQDRALAMASSFDNFVLLYVLRDQNERADLLAKLAST